MQTVYLYIYLDVSYTFCSGKIDKISCSYFELVSPQDSLVYLYHMIGRHKGNIQYVILIRFSKRYEGKQQPIVALSSSSVKTELFILSVPLQYVLISVQQL